MPAPNFDRIARPYRWLEYLTLGWALHRCRLHHLPRLLSARRALVLGDGDGRFLAALLAASPCLHAEAVDISPAMLRLLARRSKANEHRLQTRLLDARLLEPEGTFDLVVTHFFLDCLTDPELDRLVGKLVPHLSPGALWLVSDFRIPPGRLRLAARLLVRSLYLAFRVLTGLRVTRLPDHGSVLRRHGLHMVALDRSLAGLLTSELWSLQPGSPHPTSIRRTS